MLKLKQDNDMHNATCWKLQNVLPDNIRMQCDAAKIELVYKICWGGEKAPVG